MTTANDGVLGLRDSPDSIAQDKECGHGANPKKTLLIVDDEEGIRKALSFLFQSDYNVLLAESGQTAQDLAKHHPIAAAVLDIAMDGMSGIDLLAWLKTVDPTIGVVMCTAYETLETAQEAMRLGACDYVTKPFDVTIMRNAVAKAMEQHEVARQIRRNNQRLEELKKEVGNLAQQKESMRMRGEIYASIVHDINSPLTVIAGFAELIADRIRAIPNLDGKDLDCVKEYIDLLTAQVQHCSEISRRYLRYLREGCPEHTGTGITQIFTDLSRLLEIHPSAKNHRVTVEPVPSEVEVAVNGAELIQVLLNLAINGLQCSDLPHQVVIRCHLLSEAPNLSRPSDRLHDNLIVNDEFTRARPLVAISVSDTGPGIPPEVLPKIFEPFFTTKPIGQGTGLGLAIVRRIVTTAQGAIQVHTEQGRGTQFTLYLPVFDAANKTGP